jgi:hypothetical protein
VTDTTGKKPKAQQQAPKEFKGAAMQVQVHHATKTAEPEMHMFTERTSLSTAQLGKGMART